MNSMKKQDIRSFNLSEITAFFEDRNEKPFRAKQVYEWLWKNSAEDFDDMTNLSKDIRELLKNHFMINPVTIAESQVSKDRTTKFSFLLQDGLFCEGVLIPTSSRMTACISSQVGCSLSCAFCATGSMQTFRNISASEMYDQVRLIRDWANKRFDRPLTNIVYMGMGEPLLNYGNVLDSIEKITSIIGLGISPRRITISTAGISKMIQKLANDKVKFNLALSLHSAIDEKRKKIMEINESNNLESLKTALLYFCKSTEKMVTLEYILFDQFNDTQKDAKSLADFCSSMDVKVNIIEYNPVKGVPYQKSNPEATRQFQAILERSGIEVNIRRSRGKDIDAACGQLASKLEKGLA
ncbi:MAG: 23S rRNA (adenine(2503)-C(2))-methyltransferase RlmN [Candidatus Marinimicrobia bacterium]|jgi:23S rRNA (adenine2503-C2)-methyltransferase|nr:23S rRNA (adenine(2503)-C(2))-methyltransferase RlmN [Candidatus Neomarinimicrobiota bacterium]MBT3617851.1 23S rRNA (adenine(2503)-C(2))-methyltransferase RlmN [Candidatus Neomarinimicrobiota bacterium]MBT3828208.1 23S rRNA (adenine(2503)-C(2))-methyltransferase RlmN [Candidatus Neomarinimicrobiota bacterium]MBT3997125.1 23S rRNA (adenine(2503)-C(2))-methyltransferase RlmN [Candidatus Neomarinimicrobiota bacterium]MBT4280591.1 23S rRNA (adenine(2503)-C(2))-methyltransferase RlmN [Candidatus